MSTAKPGLPTRVPADEPAPPSTVFQDLHVIAEVSNSAELHGTFEVWPFTDRIWVALCSVNAFGCSQPQVRELQGAHWAAPNVGLKGLPPLGIVNLYAMRDLPYKKWVNHEANRPFGNLRAACVYDNLMLGDRSIAGTTGDFPNSAWMVLRVSLSHSGLPVDELYHWQSTQWRRALRAKAYGDTIIDAIPWGKGIAVLRRQNDFDSFRYSLLHLTDQSQRELLPTQADLIEIGIHKGALIALAGTNSAEHFAPVSKIRVIQWKSPESASKSRSITVAQGPDPTPMQVHVGDRVQIAWNELTPEPTKAQRLTVELEGEFSYSIETLPPIAVPSDDSTSLVALPAPYGGNVAPEQHWHVRGRNFWLAAVDDARSKLLLLSDQPAANWSPTPILVSEPKVEQCDHLPVNRGHSQGTAYEDYGY